MKKPSVFLAVCVLAMPAALFAAKPAKPAKTARGAKPAPAAAENTAAAPERGKAQLFAKYDANKNGTLEAEEIAAIQKDFASSAKGPLKRLDANKDGKLSDDEIKALQPVAKRGGKKGKKSVAVAKPDDKKPDEPEKKPEDPK